ncbi:MAG: hypothetical protein KJ042_09225, partial [Deltaproteobacteria bacterium]|nr:hypothetical protein [Deltaproteobacteria bacterium]
DPAVREAKPVYAAYKTLVDMIGSSRYAGDLAGVLGLSGDVFAPAFVDTCDLVVALWEGRLSGAPVTTTLPWPDDAVSAEVVSQDGESIRAMRGPAAIPVTIEPSVTYVRFGLCVD